MSFSLYIIICAFDSLIGSLARLLISLTFSLHQQTMTLHDRHDSGVFFTLQVDQSDAALPLRP